MHFEGDPASALITYSEPTEAESAISSSDAVLANRFIKVFYHSPSPKNIKDRLGNHSAVGAKVEISGDTLTRTVVNQDASQSGSGQNPLNDDTKSAEKAAVRNFGSGFK